MESRTWTSGAVALRWAKLRLRRLWKDLPFLRRSSPWLIALIINAGFAASLMTGSLMRTTKSVPHSPSAVTIFAVPPTPVPDIIPAPEVKPEPEPPAQAAPIDIAAPAADEAPSPEPNAAPLGDIASRPLPDDGRGIKLPKIALPDTDPGQGTLDGLTALNCYEQFADPDKAAECANQEGHSDWRAAVANIRPDWSDISSELRRGGVTAPEYGPDSLAGLRENQRVFRSDDTRFRPNGFESLPRYAESFGSAKEYRQYQALKDFRRYRGQSDSISSGYGQPETKPLSGWQPSWQLRDDPLIDSRDLKGLVEEE